MNIEQNRIYRAKKPSVAGGCFVNDRQVLRVNPFANTVQYDSPAVRNGSHYPIVSREKFEAWAGEDVTGTLPEGTWLNWIDYRKQRK